MESKPRLGELLRLAHKEAQVRSAIKTLDQEKLGHTLIALAAIFPEVELKFGDERVPGYTDVFSMQEGKRHEEIVMFWKSFEVKEGVRVRASTDVGLIFSWKQTENDPTWKEPEIKEIMEENQYMDVREQIIEYCKKRTITEGEAVAEGNKRLKTVSF
jgi:hypothetical protein